MKKPVALVLLSLMLMPQLVVAAEAIDSRLVGQWQGLRENVKGCDFFAWHMDFKPDGRFEVRFYADKDRKEFIFAEKGVWNAEDGVNTIKTDKVPTPDVYRYTFIDKDTVKYANIKADASSDCQQDYQFTEYRVK
jgi:hypothetical protein